MKTLLITPTVPWPTDRGGNQRTNLLYRALAGLGQVDTLLVQRRPLEPEQRLRLQRDFGLIEKTPMPRRGDIGPWRLLKPLAPRAVDRVAHNLGSHSVRYRAMPGLSERVRELHSKNRYDLFVGRYLRPIAASGAMHLAPAIVDIDDVDSQKYQSRLDRPGVGALEGVVLRWHVRRLRAAVPAAAKHAAHLWVAADADVDAIPHNSVSVLRNIPFAATGDPIAPLPPTTGSKVVLLVATMNFPVNARAIDRFVAAVWPAVVAAVPGATLKLVGSHLSEQQRARWSAVEGVDVVGFVEDLADAYAPSAFSVVPIFEGGGTKIKVLESLAFGRTTVVADHSLRGHEHLFRHDESLCVASSEAGLTEHCIALLQDPARCRRLAERGVQVVCDNFSFDSFRARVAADVDRAMQRSVK